MLFFTFLRRKSVVKRPRILYRTHKASALKLVKEKVLFFNQIYQFKYNRITVKNVKTRWGSCSSKGNLNFNYKILFLPEKLVDYIVVHELCHLGEFNHSRKFWDLVAQTMPDWKERRGELKRIKMVYK